MQASHEGPPDPSSESAEDRTRHEPRPSTREELLQFRLRARARALAAANESLLQQIAERQRLEALRRDLMRRLVNAQEAERSRIARELHDELGQQVTAMMLKLAALKQSFGDHASLRGELEVLERMARQADAAVDYLVWQLRPRTLDELGLVEALRDLAATWSRQVGIPVHVSVTGSGGARPRPEVETVLYRVSQEALHNVAKHAHARRVEIALEQTPTDIYLTIRDDGVGFDVAQEPRRLGIVGMKERASLVGGTIAIRSRPGAGTVVCAGLPREE